MRTYTPLLPNILYDFNVEIEIKKYIITKRECKYCCIIGWDFSLSLILHKYLIIKANDIF